MKELRGEVTIFLTLLLGTILIFISALLESASVSLDKSYARGTAERGVESIFAEYHITLLEEFHIFAIEATYETGEYDVENLRERLEFYSLEDVEWEVTQLQLLTDGQGVALEEQIVTYMKQKYGVSYVEDAFGMSQEWESQRIEGEEIEEEQEQASDALEEQITEGIPVEDESAEGDSVEGESVTDEVTEVVLESEYLDQLDFLTTTPILELVTPQGSSVSQGAVAEEELASNRELEVGVATYSLDEEDQVLRQMLISEYVLEHFKNAGEYLLEDEEGDSAEEKITEVDASEVDALEVEADTLLYEVEYILAGKTTDEENLTAVVNQLLILRTGVNYTCLSQSLTKKAEVNALALTITTAAGAPWLSGALEQVLLIGWAYGESVMDLRTLLAGDKIALVKTEADWQLSLTGLLNLDDAADSENGTVTEGGLGYSDYLRILLYLEDKDNQLLRGLDMIEQRIQKTCEEEYFQVDACVTQLEYVNTCTAVGGFTYEFPVAFTYR